MAISLRRRDTEDALDLALKFEVALPAFLFGRELPLPIGFVFLLVALTLLLARVSEDRVARAHDRPGQLKALLLWGSLNGVVCLLGLGAFGWLHQNRSVLAGLKVILAYTAWILGIRSVGFMLSVLRQAKGKRQTPMP